MKIRVNDKNGNVAECDIWRDEYGNLFLKNSDNCEVFADYEQGEYGFDDIIDIDIIN